MDKKYELMCTRLPKDLALRVCMSAAEPHERVELACFAQILVQRVKLKHTTLDIVQKRKNAIKLASANGHLHLALRLYSIGAECTIEFTSLWGGHFEIVRHLHSIGITLSEVNR